MRAHTHTRARTQTIWCFWVSSLVTKEMDFSLTSRSVSLQHVAMATKNLMKGLTASPVFGRKVFMWWYLQIWTGPPPKSMRVFVQVLSVYIWRSAHLRVSASFLVCMFIRVCVCVCARLTRGRGRTWVRMNESKISDCSCLHGCRSSVYF